MRTFHKQVSRIWPVKAVFNFKSFPTRTTSPFVLCHGDCPSCRTDAKGRHAILGGFAAVPQRTWGRGWDGRCPVLPSPTQAAGAILGKVDEMQQPWKASFSFHKPRGRTKMQDGTPMLVSSYPYFHEYGISLGKVSHMHRGGRDSYRSGGAILKYILAQKPRKDSMLSPNASHNWFVWMTHVVRTFLEKKWNVENGMSVSGFAGTDTLS